MPTLNTTFDTAACGVNDYDVPVALTGFGPWEVEYDVEYTDLSGNSSTESKTAIIGAYGDTDGVYDMAVDLTSLAGADAGQYTITITNLDDRISLKALNDIKGTTTANIQIVAAPTPNTGAIRHIKN